MAQTSGLRRSSPARPAAVCATLGAGPLMRGGSAQSGVVCRWLAACTLLLCTAQPGGAQVSQGLRVVPLVRDGQVFITSELRDGFTPDLRAAIHSGLKTSFTYTVELRLDVPFGFDRMIATAVVTNTVKFNNLLREYALERLLDGRIEEAVVEEDEALVREWLTLIERKPLFRTTDLQPNREYYVRVTANARPSNGSLLWPFGSGTSAQTKFTFLR